VLGDDLGAVRSEIADHMRRGAEQTEKFLRSAPDCLGKEKQREAQHDN
jgi:hypothetical protein